MLVGYHLTVLVEEMRRLGEMAVVVVERGERRVNGLAALVETVVQVATAPGIEINVVREL